jgi:hypothetical protein
VWEELLVPPNTDNATPREATRSVHRRGVDRATTAFDCQPSKAGGADQTASRGEKEYSDYRSVIVAHTDIQTRRGTAEHDDGHLTAGGASFSSSQEFT